MPQKIIEPFDEAYIRAMLRMVSASIPQIGAMLFRRKGLEVRFKFFIALSSGRNKIRVNQILLDDGMHHGIQ